MNKKGFTLTEVMAVIVIIAIIVIIVVPSIIAINKGMNTRLYNEKKETIVSAAEIYARNNPNIFNGNYKIIIYVKDLIATNYLGIDIKNNDSNCVSSDNGNNGCMINPVNKTSMNNDYVVLTKENLGVNVRYYEQGSTGDNEQLLSGTLVEQVCSKFENGSFVGKYGKGANDYCLCGNNSQGLYSAYLDSDGTLIRTSTTVNACIISGDKVNNYLKYDGQMWRVLGVYNLYNNPNKLVIKMVTDDLVDN